MVAKRKAAEKAAARVLVSTGACGIQLNVNDIAVGTPQQIKGLVDAGVADDSDGALEYAASIDAPRVDINASPVSQSNQAG